LPMLKSTDSISYAIREAEAYATRARRELHGLPHSPARHILETITHRVVHRTN
jgi:geranylgeranyl pyrophosphate synthase